MNICIECKHCERKEIDKFDEFDDSMKWTVLSYFCKSDQFGINLVTGDTVMVERLCSEIRETTGWTCFEFQKK